jgi:hypothetical protein
VGNGVRRRKENFMGFIRQQEKRLAIRLLAWQYQRNNIPVPAMEALEIHAARLVDDAHKIARERGRNVVGILKELIADIKKQK